MQNDFLLKKSSYFYDLPQEQIAQTPVTPRDASRLLVLDKESVIKNNEYNENEIISMENMTLDERVSYALLTENDGRYAVGECKGEGHIILGSEEKDNETYVYAITMYGECKKERG